MFRASLFGLVVIVFFSISAMAQVPELPSPGPRKLRALERTRSVAVSVGRTTIENLEQPEA